MLRPLIRDQKVLIASGAICFAALVVLLIVSVIDSYEILGINRWIKPMKFFMSVGVYLWTLAVYLYFVPGRELAKKVIAWGASVLMLGENVLIVMQALRRTTSHFNHATSFDDAVFSVMGMLIVVNTGLIVYLLVIYFKADIQLPRSILWGMRLGMILFLCAAVEGGYMSTTPGHSVGVADGGPGLPFVNWSTTGGDLRAAHFIGMHALQAVPIFAYAVEKLKIGSAAGLTLAFGGLYLAIFVLLFIQAVAGRPLIQNNFSLSSF
jgi:hypothetical protein